MSANHYVESFNCPTCNTKFILRGSQLTQVKMTRKKRPSYKGPFCKPDCRYKFYSDKYMRDSNGHYKSSSTN